MQHSPRLFSFHRPGCHLTKGRAALKTPVIQKRGWRLYIMHHADSVSPCKGGPETMKVKKQRQGSTLTLGKLDCTVLSEKYPLIIYLVAFRVSRARWEPKEEYQPQLLRVERPPCPAGKVHLFHPFCGPQKTDSQSGARKPVPTVSSLSPSENRKQDTFLSINAAFHSFYPWKGHTQL